jgi:hypothetical protein
LGCGIGGTVNGLAAKVTLGLGCGIGGTVNGLAPKVTLGLAGGIGGTVNGLAAKATLGLGCGIGGTVNGLAITQVATAAIAVTKTTPRILVDLGVIILYSLREGTTTHTNSNPNGSFVHPKSVIARSFF